MLARTSFLTACLTLVIGCGTPAAHRLDRVRPQPRLPARCSQQAIKESGKLQVAGAKFPKEASDRHHRATSEASEGSLEDALVLLDQAHRLDPTNTSILLDKATLMSRLGYESEEILKLHQRAVILGPENVEAQLALAESLVTLGRDDTALVHYECAALLDPTKTHEVERLALGLTSIGRPEDAEAVLAQRAQDEPRTKILWAHAVAAQGRNNEAGEALITLAEAQPHPPGQALYLRIAARYFNRASNRKRANELNKRADKLFPLRAVRTLRELPDSRVKRY